MNKQRKASEAPASRGPRKPRGLTCSNCRRRKTRCDGGQPGCKTCEVYNDDCRYEKAPPMSQIVLMAKRLREAESIIQQLKDSGSRDLQAILSSRSISFNDDSDTPRPSQHSSMSPDYDGYSENDNVTYNSDAEKSGDSAETANLFSQLSLDEDGEISYYGSTSAVHEPLEGRGHFSKTFPITTQGDDGSLRSMLVSNAQQSRQWENYAISNAAYQTHMPRETVTKLMNTHWCWIHPMFMFIYRPTFMRDMTHGGKYFSPFLLSVLTAHSSRFDQKDLSGVLPSRARLLLGAEIMKKSDITTVQGLLQLSAREIGYGSTSQAWLYSGMAFRMAIDLGLHLHSEKISNLGHLSPEDVEIRKRLMWSCFFWDKAISLYFGRMPSILDPPPEEPSNILDTSAETEPWTPYYGDPTPEEAAAAAAYPHHPQYTISNFINSCKLSVIINDIIIRLYSRRESHRADETFLHQTRDRLSKWLANTPEHLQMKPDNLPAFCPPPHILSQNLLYYTTTILLHRPYRHSSLRLPTCRDASNKMEQLLLLTEKTFGFTRCTYLMSYCIYTGASVVVEDVRSGLDVGDRLATYLRALEGAMSSCPGVNRSLSIIHNILYRRSSSSATSSSIQSALPHLVQDHRAGMYTPPQQMPPQQDVPEASYEQLVAATVAPLMRSLPAFPGQNVQFASEQDLGNAEAGFYVLDQTSGALLGGMDPSQASFLNAYPEQY